MLGLSSLRGEKRPAAREGDEVRRPRKRERYTRVACESCKSRKVKCSGKQPCSRCSELDMRCTYNDYIPQPPSDDRNAAIRARTDQKARQFTDAPPQDLGQLLSALKRTCDEIQSSTTISGVPSPPCPPLTRRRLSSEDTEFRDTTSPTNFLHSLNLARSVLQQRGVLTTPGLNYESPSVSRDPAQSLDTTMALLRAARPVLDVGYDAVSHYMTIFKLEIYPAYPCVILDFAQRKIDTIFKISSATTNSEAENLEIDLIDVEITKVVLAIAMLTEYKDTPLSSDIESHLIWNIDRNMKQETAQLEDIIIASLLAIYFILKDEAVKAWRMAGFAAKSCLELGMHKNSFYENQSGGPDKRIFSKTLFCCVYDLDKRCSFFANLPWTLHDKAIDENVFNLESRHPYLLAMIGLSRVQFEIIELINSSTPENKEDDERAEFFDFRVQKLVESIPQNGFFPPDSDVVPLPSRQTALKALFQLRASHIRMLTHIRCLSSSQALACRPQSARTLVSLVKFTVDLHGKTLKLGGLSRLLRSTFDKLLMGSVSCMFLTASHDPKEYGPMCCSHFHTALNILSQSDFRLNGWHSKMWCTLDDLRKIGGSIHMPAPERLLVQVNSSEEPSTVIEDSQRPYGEEDLFEPFESTDNELLAIFGDTNSKSLDSVNMSSYIDCMYDGLNLPPVTWNYM
ncbi:hypothetical protein ONS95_010285 [Cadophora gregata]|uniref:uncharacterized protein n=1 Tax=Cadophora gregata TaxID=51156 RepID=UPI0026DD2352|nr:uncharacterized protein ONS95_010285 [Cadophora gregata]KAK0122020.1 hypothetical protein ONS95_010285 [Cadophora gregata]